MTVANFSAQEDGDGHRPPLQMQSEMFPAGNFLAAR
jgi:hypothetical protein